MYVGGFAEIVDDTFRFLFLFGTCTGGCLSRITAKNRTFALLIQIALYMIIFAVTVLGTIVIVPSLYPKPDEKTAIDAFETYTAFKALWLCRIFGCALCFLINNFAYRLLSRSDFFDQCRRLGLRTKPPDKLVRTWNWWTKTLTYIVLGYTLMQLALSIAIYSGYVVDTEGDFRMDRVRWWLHLPLQVAVAVASTSDIICVLHGCYHSLLYWTLLDIVRIHFRICCEGLMAETGSTFSKRLIDKYHVEYTRLASIAGHLDKAFKLSCLLQLCLIIVCTCMCLFILCKGILLVEALLQCVVLAMMLSLFACVVIPAIRLKDQVSTRFLRLSYCWLWP